MASVVLLVVGCAGLVLFGCGDDGDAAGVGARGPESDSADASTARSVTTSTAPAAADPADIDSSSDYWVAGFVPDGYVPVLIIESDIERQLLYQSVDDKNDLYDSPITITAEVDPETILFAPDQVIDTIDIRGHEATVYSRHGEDGNIFAVGVTWEEREGFRIDVLGTEPVTEPQTIDIARGVTSVDESEWNRLVIALSSDRISQPLHPDAVEVPVTAGDGFELVALVPPDYPVGPEDRRVACMEVIVGEVRGGPHCDQMPKWQRVDDQVFVFGPVPPSITEVEIADADGGFGPVAVQTFPIEEHPTAFYISPLPDDVCLVDLAFFESDEPAGVNQIGPLPSDPDHPECFG